MKSDGEWTRVDWVKRTLRWAADDQRMAMKMLEHARTIMEGCGRALASLDREVQNLGAPSPGMRGQDERRDILPSGSAGGSATAPAASRPFTAPCPSGFCLGVRRTFNVCNDGNYGCVVCGWLKDAAGREWDGMDREALAPDPNAEGGER